MTSTSARVEYTPLKLKPSGGEGEGSCMASCRPVVSSLCQDLVNTSYIFVWPLVNLLVRLSAVCVSPHYGL
jgi:hypothetical protein